MIISSIICENLKIYFQQTLHAHLKNPNQAALQIAEGDNEGSETAGMCTTDSVSHICVRETPDIP